MYILIESFHGKLFHGDRKIELNKDTSQKDLEHLYIKYKYHGVIKVEEPVKKKEKKKGK